MPIQSDYMHFLFIIPQHGDGKVLQMNFIYPELLFWHSNDTRTTVNHLPDISLSVTDSQMDV